MQASNTQASFDGATQGTISWIPGFMIKLLHGCVLSNDATAACPELEAVSRRAFSAGGRFQCEICC